MKPIPWTCIAWCQNGQDVTLFHHCHKDFCLFFAYVLDPVSSFAHDNVNLVNPTPRIDTLPLAFIVRIPSQKIYTSTFCTICNIRMSQRIVVVRVLLLSDGPLLGDGEARLGGGSLCERSINIHQNISNNKLKYSPETKSSIKSILLLCIVLF